MTEQPANPDDFPPEVPAEVPDLEDLEDEPSEDGYDEDMDGDGNPQELNFE